MSSWVGPHLILRKNTHQQPTMGSSSSKAARAAGSAARKYPSRIPAQTTPAGRATNAPESRPATEATLGPTVYPQKHASSTRDVAINLDASDPELDAAYNARLTQLGPVQPSPTMSNSSTFNMSASSLNPSPTQAHDPSFAGGAPSQSSFHNQPVFPTGTNPATILLQARSRLAKEAEEEFENIGRRGAQGRRFLDVTTIRQILMLRDDMKRTPEEIEQQLELQPGIVGKLGHRGLISGPGAA
jgi:hypothetical protein